MRLSRWVLFVPVHDSTILFNTLTGSTLLVDRAVAEQLKAGLLPSDEQAEVLKEAYILLDEDVDDRSLFEFRLWKQRVDASFLLVTVLPTYACNFRCVYCSQRGIIPPHRPSMSEKTAGQVASWIATFCQQRDYRRLELAWYGGEPLLALDRALQINEEVKTLLPQVTINNFVETNGYFLARKLDSLKLLPNVTLQVSIDGPPEVHDRRRPLASGHGTFDKILEGVAEALSKFRVGIIICLDRDNINRLDDLFNLLATLRPAENLMIWFGFVQKPLYPSAHCSAYCLTYSEIADSYVRVIRQAMARGLTVTNDVSMGLCYVESLSTPIIDPLGNLYACISRIGVDDTRVGNVYEPPNLYIARKSLFVTRRPWREACWECAYLPLCRGGCRAQALTACGDDRETLCKRIIFEKAITDLIRLRVESGMKPVLAQPQLSARVGNHPGNKAT